MMSQPVAIASERAPPAIGPYSQGIVVGSLLFASGQLPLDAKGGAMPESIEEQTSAVLSNLDAVARAAGSALASAVKLTVYLADLREFAKVNEVMSATLSAPYPARATIGVAALPRGARIEIEGVFLVGEPQ
jgi:2-iminobutanoate/2-iminopropanoate deaminase